MEKETSEIVKLTERIAKDPKSKLFVPLAEEYKKSGDIEMAIHVLTEGLKNNPGYVTARSSLGRLLLDRGDLSGAQKELEEVIKAIPDNLLAQRKLGDIYVLQGRGSDALQRFRTCLALNPGDKELAALIADLDAGKDISARIPKPKALTSLGGTKQPEASASAAAAKVPSPAKVVTPVPAAPQAAPPKPSVSEEVRPASPASPQPSVDEQARSAPVTAAPQPPKQSSAAPSAPAAAKPAVPQQAAAGGRTAAHDEAEVAEEIVELEAVEPPTDIAPLRTGEPAAEQQAAAEPAQQVSAAAAEEGQFDLSERSAEPVPVPEASPAPAWDAGQPIERPEKTAPAVAETRDDINTNTLADLYIAQGFYDKAIEIYQGMLAGDPGNAVLQQKVSAIQSLAGTAERNATVVRQEAPIEKLQPAGDLFPAGVQHDQAPPKEEGMQAPAPEPQEAAERAGERPAGPEVKAAAAELPQASSPAATGAPAPPTKEVPVAQGMEPNPLLSSDAATRRQATIERLESWLKNVIKEKP